MIKKAYLKSTGRLFRKHIVRLLSIALIFIVTASLDSGFGDVAGNLKKSINVSYQEDNLHDIAITAFRNPDPSSIQIQSDFDVLKNELTNNPTKYEANTFEEYYSFDMKDTNDQKFAMRAEFRDFNNNHFDKLEILDGRLPKYNGTQGEIEVVVERETKEINSHNINDIININVYPYLLSILPITIPIPYTQQITARVVGVVKNPRMVEIQKEISEIPLDNPTNPNDLMRHINDAFYFDRNVLDTSTLLACCPTLLIGLTNRTIFNSFNNEYKNKIQSIENKINAFMENKLIFPQFVLLASLSNPMYSYGLYSLDMYADKVGMIATIFIVFFILIAVLVIYSTMSRLLDEERSSMAVLKTMGYSNTAIGFRYVLFTLIAGIIGVIFSIGPARLVSQVILNAFKIQYVTKAIEVPVIGSYFFGLVGIILITSLILVMIKSIRMANLNPVELLTHKTPKIGKKIFIEKIKPFWKKLSFKLKSTCRNVFLFKSRLIMTILSVIGSTMIVFASFCLLSCTSANMHLGINAFFMISLILVIFSGALCALVVYNITNINISERTREIATLMVCGYQNKEVTGYIFREIYILVIAGALIGLPAGYGFMHFVFNYLNISFLAYPFVSWWVYIVSPITTVLFAFLATLLLKHKILKTNMNESLKVLE